RECLALVRGFEVVRVPVQRGDAGIGSSGACVEPGDVGVHRGKRVSADGADDVPARPPLLEPRGEITGEVAGLSVLKSVLRTFVGLYFRSSRRASRTANFEPGNFSAAASRSASSRKPRPTMRSYFWRVRYAK